MSQVLVAILFLDLFPGSSEGTVPRGEEIESHAQTAPMCLRAILRSINATSGSLKLLVPHCHFSKVQDCT